MRKLCPPTLAAVLTCTAAGAAFAQQPAREAQASPSQLTVATAQARTGLLPLTGAAAKLNSWATPRPAMRAPLRAPESFPQINGIIVSSNDWDGQNLMGMYSIAMTPGATSHLIAPGIQCATNSAIVIDGLFYTQTSVRQGGMDFGVALETYDAQTWDLVETRDFNNDLMTYYGVARDPATGLVYGVLQSEDGFNNCWGTLDFVNSDITRLTDYCDHQYVALGFAQDGTLYGVAPTGNGTEFGIVNKANGEFTGIHTLSHTARYITSGCMDTKTGRFFVNIIDADRNSYMMEIDPASGTELYEYQIPGGDAIMAMYVPDDDSDKIDPQAPAAPEATVTPSASGALRVEIDITAPSLDFSGNAMTEPMTVTVKRDGQAVQTRNNVAPGESVNLVDEPEQTGKARYTVVCSNSHGEGKPYSTTVYVGINAPSAPRNLKLEETDQEGCIRFTWDPVTVDQDGMAMDPSRVTYVVFDQNNNIVSLGSSATEYEGRALAEGEPQQFISFGLYAVTKGGKSAIVNSPVIPVGTPDATPYLEDGTQASTHAVRFDGAGGGVWLRYNEAQFSDINSVSGDGGFFACKGTAIGHYGDLMTGKIAIDGLTNPALTFWTYRIDGDQPDINEMLVAVTCDGQTQQVADIVMSDLPLSGWNKVTVPLDQYAGKTVRLSFRALTMQYGYTMLDDIRIDSQLAHNLTAASLTAPERVQPNTPFSVALSLMNNGTEAASDYKVELYRNGQLVDTKIGETLQPDAMTTVTFEQILNPTDEGFNLYKAIIVYDLDQLTADNTSSERQVSLLLSAMPAPRNLTGTADINGNTLSWDEPQLTDYPQEVTEDFESYESWTQEIPGWTILDRDGGPIGSFSGVNIPGWQKGVDPSVWTLFDRSDTSVHDFPSSFDAHSGVKFMASMFNWDNSQNDEWLISPILTGAAQTISFWAKSYNAYYPECIRIWYSTGTLLPEGFVEIESARRNTLPSTWTKYTVDLPAGAKYFAINCYSINQWMLMVDDVSFTCLGSGDALHVNSYNVYRDGQVVANVTDRTWTDTDCHGTHTYAVTAVYDDAEGGVSNLLTLENQMVGISQIGANADETVTYYDLSGRRIARPDHGPCIRVTAGKAEKIIL